LVAAVERLVIMFWFDLDVQCLKIVQQSVTDPYGILKNSWIFDNGSHPGFICKFTGVECWHPDENRVLILRLGNLGLQGQFPRGLQNCASMTGLDLSTNNFSGPIPSDIARQLPSLTSLDLSYNSFSGEIPVGIANLIYLNTLYLQYNQINGHVPGEFSTLYRLQVFNVAYNHLSGPIPLSLMNFAESSFAGNQGLCDAPLTECGRRRSKRRLRLYRINDESSIGAAAGFVVGFVVAFYFPHLFVFSQKLHPYVVRI
jgi:hypothetical protein